MRNEQIVQIGDGMVIVREFRVQDVRYLLEQMRSENLDVTAEILLSQDFWRVHFTDRGCLEFTDISLDELTFSEVNEIWETVQEVNKAFFTISSSVSRLITPPSPPTI